MRLRLVVTGALERRALGRSIVHAFGASGVGLELLEPPLLLNGVTATRLPGLDAEQTPRAVRKLAEALVHESWVRRKKKEHRPDMVVAVDDLELANIDQPRVVVGWIRRAVEEILDEQQATVQRRRRVRERCAFHMLVPMPEAYLFGDRAALVRAGVSSHASIHVVGDDVESFETNDPAFLPIARERNREMKTRGYGWWKEERHPKRYLEWLVDCAGSTYTETRGGSGLAELAWASVGPPTAIRFARALFQDIADQMGVDNPLGEGPTDVCTYPARSTRRESLTLRNA